MSCGPEVEARMDRDRQESEHEREDECESAEIVVAEDGMLRIRADDQVQVRKDDAGELVADVRGTPLLRKEPEGAEEAAEHADERIAALDALDGRIRIGKDVHVAIARRCGRRRPGRPSRGRLPSGLPAPRSRTAWRRRPEPCPRARPRSGLWRCAGGVDEQDRQHVLADAEQCPLRAGQCHGPTNQSRKTWTSTLRRSRLRCSNRYTTANIAISAEDSASRSRMPKPPEPSKAPSRESRKSGMPAIRQMASVDATCTSGRRDQREEGHGAVFAPCRRRWRRGAFGAVRATSRHTAQVAPP